MSEMLLYPVPLDSGYTALVRPLSPFLRPLLLAQATAKHPDPDGETYRRPLENAFEPGLLEQPEENPAYVEALNTARAQRMLHFYELVVRHGVVVGVEETSNETLLMEYNGLLADVAHAPNMPADEWTRLVLCVLIATAEDAVNIAQAAARTVTKEGVRRAMDSFRRAV